MLKKNKKKPKIKSNTIKTKIVKTAKKEPIGKKLNPKQEKFCKLYAGNSHLFGNGTLCYAQAYGYDLQSLSDEAVYEERLIDEESGKTEKIKIDNSPYDKSYHVCQVNSNRLLSNDVINQRISDILADSMTDKEVDTEIAWVIRQRTDLSPKIQGIKEYNKMKGRVTEKREVEIKGLNLKNLYEISKMDPDEDE